MPRGEGQRGRPTGLGISGRKLWDTTVANYELADHELLLLGQACRVADRIAALDKVVDAEGVVAGEKAHPALVESRLQRIALARLIAVLRLPDQQDVRPQRRAGARGTYRFGVVTGGKA